MSFVLGVLIGFFSGGVIEFILQRIATRRTVGSSAGDRITAITDLSTFNNPGGCECNCNACMEAGVHYAGEVPT